MLPSIQSIAIAGLGNVGSQLAQAFSDAGIPVKELYSRNKELTRSWADKLHTKAVDSLSNISSDICIVCVSDSAVEEVISQLPVTIKTAYTSGSIQLQDLSRSGQIGVFYPLQTFTKGRKVNLFEVPFLIEAENPDFAKQLFDLAWKISRKVMYMGSEERRKVHLAAVFVNNFVNHQLYIAEQLASQYDFDKSLLYPLLEETVRKAMEQGAFSSQTGPARRNDLNVIQAQEAMLSGAAKEIYQVLTKSIISTYNDQL